MTDAESLLGFALPDLLRRMSTEVGDGGFGPVFGLLPLSAGDAEFDLVREYRALREAGSARAARTGWRSGLVPVFYCGCTVFEFVDCFADGNPVVPLDLGSDMESLTPVASLTERLEAWLAGRYPW